MRRSDVRNKTLNGYTNDYAFENMYENVIEKARICLRKNRMPCATNTIQIKDSFYHHQQAQNCTQSFYTLDRSPLSKVQSAFLS